MVLCVWGGGQEDTQLLYKRDTLMALALEPLTFSSNLENLISGGLASCMPEFGSRAKLIASSLKSFDRWFNEATHIVVCVPGGGHGKEGQSCLGVSERKSFRLRHLAVRGTSVFCKRFARINRVGKSIRLESSQRAESSIHFLSPQAILLHNELRCLWFLVPFLTRCSTPAAARPDPSRRVLLLVKHGPDYLVKLSKMT
ncbi:uncharacterized protein H6S33_002446 [Morchella sextelata]|uniref:uncharacterized protein n=1 Tax=Morchella sextelata TaxID=1174677 RepID=UPI001D03D9D0|nr:uncharacterized protein H6S33_002446 [Morchella sextelata]KAH0607412.1 hypothetical protein H6S33_002446 [Morchella sextelata]